MLYQSILFTLLFCFLTTADPLLPMRPPMKPHPLKKENVKPCAFPCPSNSTVIPLLHSTNRTCFSPLPALALLPYPEKCHTLAAEGMMQDHYHQVCLWNQIAVEQKKLRGLTAKYRAMRARLNMRMEIENMRFDLHRREGWAKHALKKGLKDVRIMGNYSDVPRGEKEKQLEWLTRGSGCEKCTGWKTGTTDLACEKEDP